MNGVVGCVVLVMGMGGGMESMGGVDGGKCVVVGTVYGVVE